MPTTTAPQATAKDLHDELARRGYRTRLDLADIPDVPADSVSVWRVALDRYPTDTIWAPIPGNPNSAEWVWGMQFQYGAPGDTPVHELADKVLATLPLGQRG